MQTEQITLDAGYQGIRIRFKAHLGHIPITVQVDVGFGDAVVPGPSWVGFPVLLDLPAPREAPVALTAVFAENTAKQAQRNAFLRRGRLNTSGHTLGEVTGFLRDFLMPPSVAVATRKPFDGVAALWAVGSATTR